VLPTSTTTTTIAPTTTELVTTTTEDVAGQRQHLIDEAEAAGWVIHEDPEGWSIWHPEGWEVNATESGTVISAPDLAVIGVIGFDDTEGIVDSEDYLISNLGQFVASGLIVGFDFSADDIILDVDQDGNDGAYDIWGVPVEMGSPLEVPGWAYAYYDPNTPSDLGYFFNVIDLFSTGQSLQEMAERVLLTFEPAGGY
jgi:hypothetical protein